MELIDRTLPFEPITLVPISDLQLGGPGCDLKRFSKWLAEMVALPNAYFCLLGDMQDCASPSNRKKLKDSNLYDSTIQTFESGVEKTHEQVKELLAGIAGRTLFVCEGHHKYVFEDGRDTDVMLAEYLDAPYVGTSTYCTLHFKRGTASINLNIYAQHGERSTISPSLITRHMEQALLPNWPEVDVFLIAHCHQAAAVKKEGLLRRGDDIRGKQRILCATGGWLKGYVAGNRRGGRPEGTYVEKAGLPPTSIGGVSIDIRPVHSAKHDYFKMEVSI